MHDNITWHTHETLFFLYIIIPPLFWHEQVRRRESLTFCDWRYDVVIGVFVNCDEHSHKFAGSPSKHMCDSWLRSGRSMVREAWTW
jgi:hypothetical protein